VFLHALGQARLSEARLFGRDIDQCHRHSGGEPTFGNTQAHRARANDSGATRPCKRIGSERFQHKWLLEQGDSASDTIQGDYSRMCIEITLSDRLQLKCSVSRQFGGYTTIHCILA
jgi:hypothetical protein